MSRKDVDYICARAHRATTRAFNVKMRFT